MNNEAENTMPAAEPVTGEENAAEIAAAETAPPAVKSGENGQPKPSWEELLQDPDYKSRYDQAVQGIVKARLRGRAQAEEKLARLAPVLSALEEPKHLPGTCGRGRTPTAHVDRRSPHILKACFRRRESCKRACRTSISGVRWRMRNLCA